MERIRKGDHMLDEITGEADSDPAQCRCRVAEQLPDALWLQCWAGTDDLDCYAFAQSAALGRELAGGWAQTETGPVTLTHLKYSCAIEDQVALGCRVRILGPSMWQVQGSVLSSLFP